MLIEVEPARKNSEALKNYTFYQAENGTFLYIENFLYRALIKKDLHELNLPTFEETIELRLKKRIPYADVKRIEAFCRTIKEIYNKESLIIPMFHPVKEEFSFFVPNQTAGPAFVKSEEPIIARDGFVPCGTIHAHPGSPFHSNGDIEDERMNASGIHLTVGNLNKDVPDWVATLVVHGRRVELDPNEVLELRPESPKDWIQKISLGIKVEGICAPYLSSK